VLCWVAARNASTRRRFVCDNRRDLTHVTNVRESCSGARDRPKPGLTMRNPGRKLISRTPVPINPEQSFRTDPTPGWARLELCPHRPSREEGALGTRRSMISSIWLLPWQTKGRLSVGWASAHIAKLRAGETVSFRPRGHSMKGRIGSGQLCTVAPVDVSTLNVGDVVLCKVGRGEFLHIVKAIEHGRFLIGNNRGRINGWVGRNCIFGKCVGIVD
jgi:hypothetical protein